MSYGGSVTDIYRRAASRLAGFRQGLKEVGLVEGENVTISYRWAEDRVGRLPEERAGPAGHRDRQDW
jgi:hypothetical protein